MTKETPNSPRPVSTSSEHYHKDDYIIDLILIQGIPVALWAVAWQRQNPLFLLGCAAYVLTMLAFQYWDDPDEKNAPRKGLYWGEVWEGGVCAGSALAWAMIVGPCQSIIFLVVVWTAMLKESHLLSVANVVVQVLLALVAVLAGGVFIASVSERLGPCAKCKRGDI
ncbi:hypothetical protein FA95DRAFT_1607661 [Auriscalpium vulgare]|uniref:Uncharacterized protein n=1 Tax=Auriscalpium vulgare TaxID=40419 RepID=A0ACB8RPE5_9AGAM|nr:hypothetical protein FA95DRAFT_1607661 [Auriscalpium vulgare]